MDFINYLTQEYILYKNIYIYNKDKRLEIYFKDILNPNRINNFSTYTY